jgi:hypothetical protein
VIGDTASLDQDGKPLLASRKWLCGRTIRGQVITCRKPASSAATIPLFRRRQHGRDRTRLRRSGFYAAGLTGNSMWLAWAFSPVSPASGNRVRVWTQWLWSYLTRQRSSQLIVEHKAPAPLDRHNQEEKQEVYEQARVHSS